MQHAGNGVADGLRVAIGGADRASLPRIGQSLWAALANGTNTEAEATDLGALIDSRTAPASFGRVNGLLKLPKPQPARPRDE
jgi:hypothetical protein